MIKIKHKGDFSKTTKFLFKLSEFVHLGGLDSYGKQGVEALAKATPVESGETATAWGYKIINNKYGTKLIFTNDNVTPEGTPIAILLQYGHGTRSGTYVQGIDYINPAIQPIFQELCRKIDNDIKKLK